MLYDLLLRLEISEVSPPAANPPPLTYKFRTVNSNMDREHLRRCHRRQDKAEVACSRCLAGFRTRNERDEHQRTGELCEVKDLRSSLKLGLEEEILSKRPSRINVTAEEQWEELCQSVLRSANVKISPGITFQMISTHIC